jgi:hypothetical protein
MSESEGAHRMTKQHDGLQRSTTQRRVDVRKSTTYKLLPRLIKRVKFDASERRPPLSPSELVEKILLAHFRIEDETAEYLASLNIEAP